MRDTKRQLGGRLVRHRIYEPFDVRRRGACRNPPVVTGLVASGRTVHLYAVFQIDPILTCRLEQCRHVPAPHARIAREARYVGRAGRGSLIYGEDVTLGLYQLNERAWLAQELER